MNTDRSQQWDIDHSAWHPLFSNFAPTPIIVDLPGIGRVAADTGEHAYQAAKTLDPIERSLILAMETPGWAKRRGRVAPLRPQWDDGIAIEAMRAVVRAKVEQYPNVRKALEATGDRPIIEVTAWNDTIWGTTKTGKGANQLGQILMEVRDEVGVENRMTMDKEALNQHLEEMHEGQRLWGFFANETLREHHVSLHRTQTQSAPHRHDDA